MKRRRENDTDQYDNDQSNHSTQIKFENTIFYAGDNQFFYDEYSENFQQNDELTTFLREPYRRHLSLIWC